MALDIAALQEKADFYGDEKPPRRAQKKVPEFKLIQTKKEGLFLLSASHVWKKHHRQTIFVKKKEKSISFSKETGADCVNNLIFSFKGKKPRIYDRTFNRKGGVTIRGMSPNKFPMHKMNFLAQNFSYTNHLEPKLEKFIIDELRKYCPDSKDSTDIHDYLNHLVYEGAEHFITKNGKINLDPIYYKYIKHTNDLDKIIRGILGYSSKSIKKLFIEQKETRFNWALAHVFKRKIAVDYIRQILELKPLTFDKKYLEHKNEQKLFKKFFLLFLGKEKKLINMLKKCSMDTAVPYTHRPHYILNDTLRSYETVIAAEPNYDIFENSFSDLTELHDILAKKARKIKTPTVNIYRDELKDLDNLKMNDIISFQIPETNEELSDWAETLGNCMGGYSRIVQSGHSKIVGVFVNGELTYGIELRIVVPAFGDGTSHHTITQFLARFNRQPDEEHNKSVREFLDKWLWDHIDNPELNK